MKEPSAFYKAVMKNRVADVKRFLKNGESPDSLAGVYAIQYKAHDALKELIREGFDINKPEAYWRYTPLIRALHEKNVAAFRILLKAGAIVDKRGEHRAPLHYAAEKGLPEFAKLCLASRAKVDQRDRSGNTPLMWAATMGHLEVVKLLLKAGANPLALNLADQTPCQMAAENGETAITRLLEPISKRKPPVKRGVPALVEAVAKQDMAALKKHLAKGADVNGRDRFGRSPLNKAIGVGLVPMVRQLIEAGIDVNKLGPDGVSFLEGALRSEQREIAKILLEAGALPNPPGNRFDDAIHTASALGDVELVKLLISKGSDPKHPEALNSAARKKSPELMELLLAAGADVNCVDGLGQTPIFYATFVPPPLCARYRVKELKARGKGIVITPNPKPKLVEQCVRLLFEHGADLNHANCQGRTPLTYARFVRVARILIEAGARLDLKDKDGHDVRYWLKKNGVKI